MANRAKVRQEKVYDYWNQGIVEPKAIKEKLKQKWNIEVSEQTVKRDLQDLEKQGKIKIITKEEKTEKRREIIKELYGEKGLTGEKLRQETNKRLKEVFGIPFSFSMPVIEKDIKFLKDKNEVTEEAKKQRMQQTHLETIEKDLKRVENLVKEGKTIDQIASIVEIHTDTVKEYKKILRNQGRLTGKEKPRRQATIKKEKRMKRDRKRIKEEQELLFQRQDRQGRKDELVELIKLGEEDKNKIADTLDISLSTVEMYMRELREEGKLVSKKQLEIQVIKMWNKELPYKEIQKKIKKDYNKDININHIINSFGKRIKKLSEKYEVYN